MRASLALGLLLATGCLRTAAAPQVPLAETEWVLSSLSGQAPLAGSRLTVRFQKEGAGGYTGCNWYGGPYRVSGRELSFEEMSSTLRGCQAPGVAEQERAYLDALGRVRAYRIAGERLLLQDAGGAPLLEFTRRVPLAMNPADLVGMRWTLQRLGDAPPIPGAPIRMAFVSADTIRGFAGCRSFESKYRARGDEIGVSETRMGSTECDAPDAILEQEGNFTSDLSEAAYWKLAGDRLEIFTVHGRTLVFARTE